MDERTGLPVVGMVGGGQLARMTHQAAIALGQSLRVLAERPDDGAALVAPDVEIGAPSDLDALRRFAASCDVVTFDHEHVPGPHLRALAAEGVTVYPPADALQYAQDKALMRQRLGDAGVPVPPFVVVPGADLSAAAAAFGAAHGWPIVVKTATGGYDGRGVWIVPGPGESAGSGERAGAAGHRETASPTKIATSTETVVPAAGARVAGGGRSTDRVVGAGGSATRTAEDGRSADRAAGDGKGAAQVAEDGRSATRTAEDGRSADQIAEDGPSADQAARLEPGAPTGGDLSGIRGLPRLAADTVAVVEAYAPIRRELAAVVARSPFGQATAWPVVQTVQRDGICVEVIAPAPDLPDATAAAATTLALRIAETLGVVGVLAVELFEVDPTPEAPDGLVVNELAMRPHNSAHWTIEGSLTSQFEQHLRAVLDYPLGATDPVAPFAVMGNVLGGSDPAGAAVSVDERVHHLAARFPEVKVHLYGKGFRVGRKLGHVTVLGDDLLALRRRARLAADFLGDGVWSDGYPLHPDGERRAILRADAFPPRHQTGVAHPDPSNAPRPSRETG